ncbi:MAG: hypothetical protein NXI04_07280 [Planctomycetaceae bacterium]|nr:hypothetical protein [Planctomycetaceae bacterium]
MNPPPASKQKLLALLNQQRQHYENALRLITDGEGPSTRQATAAASLIQASMQELADIDRQITQLRPELERSGELKQPEIQQVIAAHEQVLRTLIDKLDASLGIAGQQQAVLSQTLDGGAARKSAQQAYRVSLKTG